LAFVDRVSGIPDCSYSWIDRRGRTAGINVRHREGPAARNQSQCDITTASSANTTAGEQLAAADSEQEHL